MNKNSYTRKHHREEGKDNPPGLPSLPRDSYVMDNKQIRERFEQATGEKAPDRYTQTREDPGIQMQDILWGLLCLLIVLVVYSCTG